MISVRVSPHAQRNTGITSLPRIAGEDNGAWLRRASSTLGGDAAVVLLGGARLLDFRLRLAQAHVRVDMLPSYWSDAALLLGDGGGELELWSAGLLAGCELDSVPKYNGVNTVDIDRIRSVQHYPNAALLRFSGPTAQALRESAALLRMGRLSLDLITPMLRWTGFCWGCEGYGNPLLQNTGLPSALFVDAAFAQRQVDLVPGLGERASCPEAIWQAALWWGDFYQEGPAGQAAPLGAFVVDQPAAAVSVEP